MNIFSCIESEWFFHSVGVTNQIGLINERTRGGSHTYQLIGNECVKQKQIRSGKDPYCHKHNLQPKVCLQLIRMLWTLHPCHSTPTPTDLLENESYNLLVINSFVEESQIWFIRSVSTFWHLFIHIFVDWKKASILPEKSKLVSQLLGVK